MKTLFYTLSVVLTLSFIVGCESNECIECSYEVANLTQSSGQQCGTKDEVDAVEFEWTQMATDAGGSEVLCVKSE